MRQIILFPPLLASYNQVLLVNGILILCCLYPTSEDVYYGHLVVGYMRATAFD